MHLFLTFSAALGIACIIPILPPLEFEGFRKEAGLNAFTLSPHKWTNATNAVGIISKSGRYGGTKVFPKASV